MCVCGCLWLRAGQALEGDGRARAWLSLCSDVLDLSKWLCSGDYAACLLTSPAGKAVLGPAAHLEEFTPSALQSLPGLVAALRHRVVKFVLHGAGGDDEGGDCYVDPDPTGPDGASNPASLRAVSVVFVAAACLSLFVQVRASAVCV